MLSGQAALKSSLPQQLLIYFVDKQTTCLGPWSSDKWLDEEFAWQEVLLVPND